MKKRRRLKSWVKVTLGSLLFGGFILAVMIIGDNRMNDFYEQCDNAKGHTCTYYEARLYSIRGE